MRTKKIILGLLLVFFLIGCEGESKKETTEEYVCNPEEEYCEEYYYNDIEEYVCNPNEDYCEEYDYYDDSNYEYTESETVLPDEYSEGNDSDYEYSEMVNQTPTVDAGADKTAIINETVILKGSATDSDGMIVSYEWTKNGTVFGTEATLRYRPTEVGTDTLTLTVMDDDGDSGSDSVNIIVTAEQGATDDEEDIDSDFGGKK